MYGKSVFRYFFVTHFTMFLRVLKSNTISYVYSFCKWGVRPCVILIYTYLVGLFIPCMLEFLEIKLSGTSSTILVGAWLVTSNLSNLVSILLILCTLSPFIITYPVIYLFFIKLINIQISFIDDSSQLWLVLNPLLLNSLNLIHPITLYGIFVYLLALCLWSLFLRFYTFNSSTTTSTCTRLLFTSSLLLALTTLLGSLWAAQLESWGGWWVWDPSETLLLVMFALLGITIHLVFLQKNYFKFQNLLVLLTVCWLCYRNYIFNWLPQTLHTFTPHIETFEILGTSVLSTAALVVVITQSRNLRHIPASSSLQIRPLLMGFVFLVMTPFTLFNYSGIFSILWIIYILYFTMRIRSFITTHVFIVVFIFNSFIRTLGALKLPITETVSDLVFSDILLLEKLSNKYSVFLEAETITVSTLLSNYALSLKLTISILILESDYFRFLI